MWLRKRIKDCGDPRIVGVVVPHFCAVRHKMAFFVPVALGNARIVPTRAKIQMFLFLELQTQILLEAPDFSLRRCCLQANISAVMHLEIWGTSFFFLCTSRNSLLASSGYRSEMLPNSLKCIGLPLQQRTIWPKCLGWEILPKAMALLLNLRDCRTVGTYKYHRLSRHYMAACGHHKVCGSDWEGGERGPGRVLFGPIYITGWPDTVMTDCIQNCTSLGHVEWKWKIPKRSPLFSYHLFFSLKWKLMSLPTETVFYVSITSPIWFHVVTLITAFIKLLPFPLLD